MVTEKMENGVYTSYNGDRLLLTITDMGNNVYRAVNLDCDITAVIVPIDDYKVRMTCIEHKRRGRDGRYRKSKKLLEHNLGWLEYMLEEKGFIRKTKAM